MRNKWNILALSFVLLAVGFLLSFWPLSAAGVILAALTGRYIWAVFFGVLLDLAYGIPLGPLHILYAPFTLLALLCAAARLFVRKRMFDKSPPESL